MFCIVDNIVLAGEDEYEISAAINEISGSLELNWDIPCNQKIGLSLCAGSRKNLISEQLYSQGESLEIPLKNFNADSFTLEVLDENGKAISQYRIMRSYC